MGNIEGDTWATVRAFMQRKCGVVLAADQSYLLEARLGPVAKSHKFNSIADFVTASCSQIGTTPLTDSLIDPMTTHETSFFRDPTFWKTFETVVMPQVIAAGNGPVRIWSAACSHGQEPYSIAMLLAERWPSVAENVDILATDISEPALDKAKSGIFTTLEVNRGLGAARMVRHFEQVAGGFRVKPKLRERIRWRPHNLLGASACEGSFDIVLCRNVLIYFDESDRRAALKRLFESARPTGFIGVGATENTSRTPVAAGWFLNDTQKVRGVK